MVEASIVRASTLLDDVILRDRTGRGSISAVLADFWTTAITSATATVVLALFALLPRRQPKLESGQLVLQLARPMRWFTRFAVALFAALLTYALVDALVTGEAESWRALMLGVPVLGPLIVIAERELRVRYSFDEHGIRGTTAWRGEQAVLWRDLISARWSNSGYWLRLDGQNGEVLRISGWLQGFDHMLAALVQNAPAAVGEAVLEWRKGLHR